MAEKMVPAFIVRYVHFERSYESYSINADHVYRIPLEYRESSDNNYIEATNYPGGALIRLFPFFVNGFSSFNKKPANRIATFAA